MPTLPTNLTKLSTAMRLFRRWARGRGLNPSETAYVARTRDRRRLRFSKSGDPSIERAYRTHWVSPQLPEKKRRRLADRQSRAPQLVVISPIKDWTCTECGGSGGLLLMEGPGPLCMRCADMDHLVFLPAGDAALTRRARKGSRLAAVVVRFSCARKRYERQGILVEEAALERAETECLAETRLGHGGGSARAPVGRRKTPSFRWRWRKRSGGCSLAVPAGGRSPSPATPAPEGVGAWGGPRPAGRWVSRRSGWLLLPRRDTATRDTTSC